jgi:predicted transcriptional regulator
LYAVNAKELSEKFNLHVAAGRNHLDRQILGGYCGDLLSDVMANAPAGCIWLTVQTHQNIVAVAVLHEMAAIVLTGGQEPDRETIEKAEEDGIPILMWPATAFELAGQVHAAGVTNT